MNRSFAPNGIRDGFPDYIDYGNLASVERDFLDWYKLNAPEYDSFLPITFEILGCNEGLERQKLYQALNLKPSSKVLEIGAGTGRDSVEIAKSLDTAGFLVMQDISSDILKICKSKFESLRLERVIDCGFDFFLSSAGNIPYEDNTFDRVFHFGGLNTFGDIRKSLEEINRVAKDGAIVVIGDEGVAPWLRSSRFAALLVATNSQYLNSPPIEQLPESSCNVRLEWFCSESFYFISYTVEKNPRSLANFDVEIPGVRGGTPRKRLEGVLEGISPELKKEIYDRVRTMGISRVDLIEQAIKRFLNGSS